MVLVDANGLLDILTADAQWSAWSAEKLERALGQGLGINPVIYAEISVSFRSEADWTPPLIFPI